MRHILQVFIYELSRNVRRKGYLFSTFGIPLLAILLLFGYQGLQNLSADENTTTKAAAELDLGGITRAGFVDESGLIAEPGTQLSEVLVRYADWAAAEAALQQGEIDAYYLVPQDYLNTGDVELVLPTLAINKINASLIRQLILNTLAVDVEPEIYGRLQSPAMIDEFNLSGRERPDGTIQQQSFDTSFLLVYVFTLALMLSLFTTNGYLMQGLIEEKETRVIEILISSLRPWQLLTGKILAFGLLGLLQMAAWITGLIVILQFSDALSAISVLANLYLPLDILPLVLLYFVLAYLLFAAAYGIVGALSTSMQEGPQYAVIFTLPAALPLYFIGLVVESPDAPLVIALSFFPLTAPVAMIMRLIIAAVPAWQILLSIALLAVSIIGILWLAGRLFRVQTLLAGQMPKLRDLPRLVRG